MSIESIHKSKQGKVSDKWSSYFDHYERLFSHLKSRKVSLLEIGVQNGGSLETWASYFKNGKTFVGSDIDPDCAALRFDDERIHVVIGDINTQATYDAIQRIERSFDIIIDDGSHKSHDILTSFASYFPVLKPGGVYVVEDAHTLYMDKFNGGILNEGSAQKFFYRLADLINYQFWQNQISLEVFFRTFFAGALPDFIREGWVDSVSFRNSIITIEKSKQSGHLKLGEKVVSGNLAAVDDRVLASKNKQATRVAKSDV